MKTQWSSPFSNGEDISRHPQRKPRHVGRTAAKQEGITTLSTQLHRSRRRIAALNLQTESQNLLLSTACLLARVSCT